MRARILDAQVKLYSGPEPNALSLATLAAGTEIEFGKMIRKGGKQWFEVILPTGQKGYIAAQTRVYPFRLAAPLQNNVRVYNQPNPQSLVRTTLKRSDKVFMVDVMRAENQEWVKVRDMNGVEGYIPGQTRMRVFAQKSKALARRSLISGALWCIGGAVVIGIGSSAAGSSTMILAWGAILYGAVQVIMGIYQYVTANS